jgi:hypothetical protein
MSSKIVRAGLSGYANRAPAAGKKTVSACAEIAPPNPADSANVDD